MIGATTPFVWGRGGVALTPEQIERRRRVEDAIAARGVDSSPVGHWSEGASRVVAGLGSALRSRQLDRMEKEGRESGNAAYSKIIASLSGGQSPQSEPISYDPDVYGAAGAESSAAGIRDGLIKRGLPEHIADGFVMNFADESGMDPAINEKAPLVPGSRGGFGLAQWTGPRREALEAFAAKSGKSVADPDVQMDFMMSELQGPEAEANKIIMASADPNAAASAIATHFLRPSADNLQARVAKYGQRAPANQTAQAGGLTPEMIEAAGNEFLTDGQRSVVNALIGQRIKESGPVDPIEVNGRLVNPRNGSVVADFSEAPKPTIVPEGSTVLGPDNKPVFTGPPKNKEDAPSIRKEIQQLPSYKNLAQAAPVYKSMVEAAGRDNRAADVNLIYGMAKIMDPTSVVRESEMTIAQAIATLPQQMQAAVKSQMEGAGRLAPDVRAGIMQEAFSRIGAYKGMFDQDMTGTYKGLVQRNNFNEADIIPSFGDFPEWKPATAPGIPEGMDPKVWQHMTTEERALFQ